jgi:redox-sensitive bicupin YhaK (pirin superfamily)
MLTLRPAARRGHTRIDWLDSWHTFSFGEYRDPRHTGFRALRVINEDRVRPGQGFGTHGHRDMEIVTWVLSGALAHRDSLGNGSTIQPGEAQRMSAGTGIRHSEFNASQEEEVHFLQIWILPEREGLEPGYEQRAIPIAERPGRLVLLASREGRDGSVTVHQDVSVWAGRLPAGERLDVPLRAGRHAWLQLARGALAVNGGGAALAAGDGLAASDEPRLALEAREPSELLLFDLA